MLCRFFAFRHPAWSLLGITKASAWLGWVVLTGVRRVHQISGFAYLNYYATWCRIILLFLFLSHCFFDLIKNSCYCSIDVALLRHLYIYILTNSLFILSDCLPSPPSTGRQHITAACLKHWWVKTKLIRELQWIIVIKSVLKTSLFCFLDSSQTGTKRRTKETPRSPLFTTVTPRFARAYAWKKIRVVTPALLEREYKIIWNYQI